MTGARGTFLFGRRWVAQVSFLVGISLVLIFAFVPAFGVLFISFTDVRSLPYYPTHWVGFDNYREFFSASYLSYNMQALQNTLVFAVSVTVLQNVIAFFVAILLNMPLRGRVIYRAIVFAPTILGVTVIGLIFQLIFNPSRGPAASLWKLFSSGSAFFGDPHLAMALVIFVQVWMGLGVAVVIYIAGLQSIPTELYEVANIDGANSWQRLRLITLPMLAPSVTTNTLLCIIGSLQSYQLIYILTGTQNPATQVLSIAIYAQGFSGAQPGAGAQSQGYAASISIVQFVLVALISLLALRFLRRRETSL